MVAIKDHNKISDTFYVTKINCKCGIRIHTFSFEERSDIGDEADGDPVPRLFLGDDNWLNDGPASTRIKVG